MRLDPETMVVIGAACFLSAGTTFILACVGDVPYLIPVLLQLLSISWLVSAAAREQLHEDAPPANQGEKPERPTPVIGDDALESARQMVERAYQEVP